MSSISTIALQGIQRGLESANHNAQRVIEGFSLQAETEPSDAIVALKMDLFAVRASAKLIAVDEELNKSVLDIIA